MPFYQYSHNCGYQALLQRKVSDHIMGACPQCGAREELRPVIDRSTAPNIMLSSVTNHVYNNGMGRYDEGLGQVIDSRQKHRQVMKEMDVVESDISSPEEMVEAYNNQMESVPEPSMDYVKDRYEYYKAEVDKGLTYDKAPEFTGGDSHKDLTEGGNDE